MADKPFNPFDRDRLDEEIQEETDASVTEAFKRHLNDLHNTVTETYNDMLTALLVPRDPIKIATHIPDPWALARQTVTDPAGMALLAMCERMGMEMGLSMASAMLISSYSIVQGLLAAEGMKLEAVPDPDDPTNRLFTLRIAPLSGEGV